MQKCCIPVGLARAQGLLCGPLVIFQRPAFQPTPPNELLLSRVQISLLRILTIESHSTAATLMTGLYA
jgi:hypothetical protein